MDKYKGLTDKELLERLKKYSIPHGPIVGMNKGNDVTISGSAMWGVVFGKWKKTASQE